MKVRHRAKISLVLLATLSFIVALASHLGATEYILYNLDSTTQVNQGGDAAYGINDLGQVVGGIQPGSLGGQAWIWDWNTKAKTPLPNASGYDYSTARGINNSGVIVGTFYNDTSIYNRTAFIYDSINNTMQPLSTTSGHSSEGNAINNSGQVVGTSYTYDPSNGVISLQRAFKYDGTMHDLGALPDYNGNPRDIAHANAVNNPGQATGFSQGGWSYPQGVLFSNGTVQDLGSLSGETNPSNTAIYTIARGMNDHGDIVGNSSGRAFLWTSTGGIQGLSLDESVAYDINNNGQIVGKLGSDPYIGGTAFIWTAEGGLQSLADLVVNKDELAAVGGLGTAMAINDNGWIVGYGSHPFLLVPTPLPGSLLLLGSGLLGLGAVSWRRKRS